MLKASSIPSPLLPEAARPAVPIHPVQRPTGIRILYVLACFAGLAAAFVRSQLRRADDPAYFAREVRATFERMGGLWIKAGQFMALRIDLLPDALCRELARLQTRALGFPPALARQIVEQELGAPIDHIFDAWEDAPFAAASIGQVHRARLRLEQVWVAVKVQKPYSAELFARDFAVMAGVAHVAHALGIYRHMRWGEGLTELRQIMREELDFGFEAASTRKMRRVLKAHHVYVPKVFSRHCTARVMVTEFLDMVLMADYLRVAQTDPDRLRAWQADNGIRPRLVARRLVHSFQRQMMEDNRFHGDMHPGNIGLLRNSRVALIDFGTTNFTEREYLQKFRGFMRTLAAGEFAKGADLCLMLCASLPPIDLGDIHARLTRVLQSWATRAWVKALPFHEKSMDNLTLEVMLVLLGDGCTMDWAWLRLHRASSTLDASLIELHPGIDYRKVTAQYFRKAEARRLRRAVSTMGVRRTLSIVNAALDVPARLRDYAALQGALIRREVTVFQGIVDRTTASLSTILSLSRMLVLVQAATTIVAAGATGMTVFGPAVSRWLGDLPLRVPATDPRSLVAVLVIDVWIWLALARLHHVIGGHRVAPHRQVVPA
jgi:ubiquinone biosynthesis protein